MLHKVKLTHRFVPLTNLFMAGYHPVHFYEREEESTAPTSLPKCAYHGKWLLTKSASALSSLSSAALLLVVSPLMQERSFLAWIVLWSCDWGCQVLHTLFGPVAEWGQDSEESGLRNLNLYHCKCNHTQVQHFFASQQDGGRNLRELYVTSMGFCCSHCLFFLFGKFPVLLQQYLPKPDPQASATSSWSKRRVQ